MTSRQEDTQVIGPPASRPESPGGKTVVVALGGNALLQDHERGTAAEQYANLERACKYLVPLIRDGHKLILIHGNGPQVGNLLTQQEESDAFAPMQPLDICVGMTQGQVGTMLERALANQLRAAGIQRDVVAFVSHFLVDPHDPDFQVLSKPIGPFLTEELKGRYEGRPGQVVRNVGGHDPERPYRRCVASPNPLRLIEKRALKALSYTGIIVAAAGGGGIPVVMDEEGAYTSIEAVIDKDLAGEKIAESVAADIYLILTDVEAVALDFGTERARPLKRVTLDEAKQYFEEGHFALGSMAPKVLACIQFIEYGGEAAIIAGLESAERAMRGEAGTRFFNQ